MNPPVLRYMFKKTTQPSVDISGLKFGHLTPVSPLYSIPKKGWLWLCQCDCGRDCDVLHGKITDKRNPNVSCGKCKREESFGGEWRSVLGWSKYEVSSDGQVRRGPHKLNTFLVLGYPSFNVIDGKRRASLRVHREVCRAFKGDSDMIVRHLDGNPQNNHVSNLEWGTYRDNEADKERHGRSLIGERHHQAKLSASDVRFILESTDSNSELAAKFSVTPDHIGSIRKGRTWRKALL